MAPFISVFQQVSLFKNIVSRQCDLMNQEDMNGTLEAFFNKAMITGSQTAAS
jgi:hypothetical protein